VEVLLGVPKVEVPLGAPPKAEVLLGVPKVEVPLDAPPKAEVLPGVPKVEVLLGAPPKVEVPLGEPKVEVLLGAPNADVPLDRDKDGAAGASPSSEGVFVAKLDNPKKQKMIFFR
jgi:hypothetical protein